MEKRTEQTIIACGQSKYTQLFIRHTLINQDYIYSCLLGLYFYDFYCGRGTIWRSLVNILLDWAETEAEN